MANPSFWDFSLRIYAAHGVAEACLQAQDEFDLDVNLILFCAWLADNRYRASEQQLDEAIKLASQWANSAVRPLRAIRRELKTFRAEHMPADAVETIRAQVKKLELDSEHQQQLAMQALAQQWQLQACSAGSAELFRLQLRSYLDRKYQDRKGLKGDKLFEILAPLLTAAFTD